MELFFRKYFRWLHHKSHTLRRKVFHNQAIKEFFASKNARLAVILIIAAAIPLTVLAVQQIQDIRQQAKAPNMCNGGATGLLVVPNPADDGAKITFTHTGAFPPIDQSSFENDDFTGGGAKDCTFSGSAITCTARNQGNDPVANKTWTYHGVECNYQVKKPVKPTKNPNATPTRRTPKPTSTPKQNAGFDADIKADGCNASKIARLKVKWDATSGKTCKVTLEGGGQKEERTKCDSDDLIYDALPRGSSNDLKSKTAYKLTVTVDGKSKEAEATTAECVKTDKTPAPTLKPGQATPTLGNGVCPNTKIILDVNQSSCTTGGKTKISGSWNISGAECVVSLYEDGAIIGKATQCVNNAWYTSDGIEPGKTYQLQATSNILCSNNNLRSNTITAKACIPNPTQVPGSAGADDIDVNATPTKVLAF